MTWIIWDKEVDATFRPDFEEMTGEKLPRNPPSTIGGSLLHYSENLTKEAIENIGKIYGDYVIFRIEF